MWHNWKHLTLAVNQAPFSTRRHHLISLHTTFVHWNVSIVCISMFNCNYRIHQTHTIISVKNVSIWCILEPFSIHNRYPASIAWIPTIFFRNSNQCHLFFLLFVPTAVKHNLSLLGEKLDFLSMNRVAQCGWITSLFWLVWLVSVDKHCCWSVTNYFPPTHTTPRAHKLHDSPLTGAKTRKTTVLHTHTHTTTSII